MQAEDLARVADELYALAPADFRAARDGRAGEARASGDRELADAVRKLRRPTVSAWLVNQLAREAPHQIGELIDLANELREAQETLAGDRLRELSARRRRAVTAIIQEAKRLASQASQSVGAQVEREVEATLEAAVADPAAADAVRSGRLTSALSYAGLGSVDLSDAVAVPGASPARPGARGTGQPSSAPPRERPPRGAVGAGQPGAAAAERESAVAQRKAREAELAERELADAVAAAQEAKDALDEAAQEVASARREHESVRREIEDLEHRLEQAQASEAQLARAVRDAQRGRDVAARSLDTAQRRLGRAEAKAAQYR